MLPPGAKQLARAIRVLLSRPEQTCEMATTRRNQIARMLTFSNWSDGQIEEEDATATTQIDHQSENAENEKLQRRINVCYLIDNLDIAGTENHLLGLLRDLDRSLFNPLVILLDGENDASRQLEPDHCEVLRLGVRSFYRLSIISKAYQFICVLRHRNIDVLQMYFPDSTMFGAICGKLAGVPNLIRTRRNTGYWMTSLHRIRCLFISTLVTKTIANSEASRKSVIEQEGAPANSVIVIPNGVDLGSFLLRRLPPLGQQRTRLKRVAMLANLRPVKCVDVFISAAAQILKVRTDCLFEIAGEGSLRDELQALIDHLGVATHVKLLGAMSNVPDYLALLDIVVSCSSAEGLSNSLLEAMATELPVIATDVEGNRSLIEHGNNGLLFPVGDVDRLAKSICQLLDDDALANTIGKSGRNLVERQFDQLAMIQRYQEIYVNMVEHTCKKKDSR